MSTSDDRPVGTPAAFADRRGGPSTHAGIRYQDDVSLYETLRLIDIARYDPTTTVVLKAEPRLLVDRERLAEGLDAAGQLGFDLGWTGCPGEPDTVVEVKMKPTATEAREFVARLPRLLAMGCGERSVWMVAATSTAPFEALKRLLFHAREASDSDALLRLVAAAADTAEMDLLTCAGDDAMAALALARAEQLASLVVQDQVGSRARSLAMPGRWEDLVRVLRERVAVGAEGREAIGLAGLIAQLTEDGVLAPPPRADVSHLPSELVVSLKVLTACPLPVPLPVLASAAGVDVDSVAVALDEHVRLGIVAVTDSGDYVAGTWTMELPVPAGHEGWAGDGLRGLIEHRRAVGGRHVEQSANALALARLCRQTAPEVVAETFIEFDKASKAYGDLTVIDHLAHLSNEAAVAMVSRQPEQAHRWAVVRARNYICGIGWVLQRVDELEGAATAMADAERLSAFAEDPENMAFAAKCTGRLLRMRAEAEPSLEAAEVLFEESAAKLAEAFALFEGVLRTRPGFDEDYGECKSLLARTRATQMRLQDARDEAVEAHRHLDRLGGSKAYADLVILDAEIDLRDRELHPDDDTLTGRLAWHQETLRVLQDTHPVLDDPQRHRGPSEIAARLLLIRGQLAVALGDADEAEPLFERAADVYARLEYPTAAERAAWDAFTLHPDAVPAGLMAALDRMHAPPGARLLAVQGLERDGSLAAEHDSDETHPRWDGHARDAIEKHAAKSTHWGGERVV